MEHWQDGLYCTDVAVQVIKLRVRTRTRILRLFSLTDLKLFDQHHHAAAVLRFDQVGLCPVLWGLGFFQGAQARKMVRKAGLALPPSMMSKLSCRYGYHWNPYARRSIDDMHWLFHKPEMSKETHFPPSYNPYLCTCRPDNRTGDLS